MPIGAKRPRDSERTTCKLSLNCHGGSQNSRFYFVKSEKWVTPFRQESTRKSATVPLRHEMERKTLMAMQKARRRNLRQQVDTLT